MDISAPSHRTPSQADAVFILGLPRSGSTLLSRLLNSAPDLLSVNDLYFLQAVLAEGLETAPLTDAQAARLADQLVSVITTRATAKEEFIGQFSIDQDRVARIKDDALRQQALRPLRWYELLDLLLDGVARAAGKRRWADKTPQNFYHFALLSKCFARARFVFLFRDPGAILASYRFATGEGHDARRYHPFVYALYWRSAVRYFQQLKGDPRVHMVRYEDLVHAPAATCAALAAFLGTTIPVHDLAGIGNNSSFSGATRQAASPTESWLCQWLCKTEMDELGYARFDSRPRFRELLGLVSVTATFVAFQTARLLQDRDARRRAWTYLKGLRRPLARPVTEPR